MIKEAIEKVMTLVPPTLNPGAPGWMLSDRQLHAFDVRKPLDDCMEVNTLSALVNLLAAKVNGIDPKQMVITVQSHLRVDLSSIACDDFGRRHDHVIAKLPTYDGFKFGQFLDQESFLIGVMANFTADGDREYLLRIASNLTNERVVSAEDNGITQQVGLKKGAALKSTETLRQRVILAPYRTFCEVTQPSSEFVFRVRQGEEGGIPTLGLFEADGGKWKIDAALAVRDWFSGKVGDIPVVA